MTKRSNIVQFQEVHPLLESDHTSLFTPNPHINGYKLASAHHNEGLPKKFKEGYVHQVVTLEHKGNKYKHEVVLGYVTTKTVTPKRAQHKIMTNVFGYLDGELIIRDRDVLNLLADHLGAPFKIVSNRSLRSIGLVEWAIREGCTAVYTPEGYDQYLLDQLQQYIHDKKYKLVLITKMDGGLVQVT